MKRQRNEYIRDGERKKSLNGMGGWRLEFYRKNNRKESLAMKVHESLKNLFRNSSVQANLLFLSTILSFILRWDLKTHLLASLVLYWVLIEPFSYSLMNLMMKTMRKRKTIFYVIIYEHFVMIQHAFVFFI